MNLKKTYLFTSVAFVLIVVFSCGILLNGCKNKGSRAYQLTGDSIADGKNLAQLHCTKCHSLVPVDALNKDVWQFHTLPAMAHYLGLKSYLNGYYKDDNDTSGLSLIEWQSIVSYYKKMAPATLPGGKTPEPLINDWAGFTLKTPKPVNGVSFTTMVSVDPVTHKIYSSDNHSIALLEWDSNLNFKPVSTLPSAAVAGTFVKDAAGENQGIFTCIGRLEPMDFPNGRVVNVNLDTKDTKANQKLVASDLARPVQTVAADFNKDGLTDLVICGEGNLKGGVYLFTQKADHSYKQTNISEKPGAVQAITGDFNNDGWQDVMVLYGTGDEGLWLYLNDHKGGFTTKNLLRFPPVYGSSSFQLADVDRDGKPDLIYTCGYNFRDSRILKPYHGLYIFKNTGDWNFKQQWFYPINGCTKAIAADFDGDGDIDIATTAFFADMQNNPAESFIYFEQDKPFSFKPHAIPVSKYGRWMSMDIGDYNNDGQPDIVLGNYSSGFMFQPGFKPFWTKDIPLIVLENHTKK